MVPAGQSFNGTADIFLPYPLYPEDYAQVRARTGPTTIGPGITIHGGTQLGFGPFFGAVGNLNDFVKYQMGKGLETGSGGGGPAGTAAELAVGFGLAQQMMRDGFAGGNATPTAGPVLPELMSPAEAAQALGVAEADVMAVLESGELKGKKIGTAWRIPRGALTSYMAQ